MSRPAPRPELTAAEQARLRARYPPSRIPRPVAVVLVVVAAGAGLSWLLWAALYHSSPPVTGQVTAYTVRSDTEISVTLTVDRPDPSLKASCRIQAKAPDFQPVGEVVVPVPPTTYRTGNIVVSITTVRRATSAEVATCTVI